jgi:hypothetical protein
MSRPPDVQEMNCLMFGDKSSPCEANYAVIRTTEDNMEEWPVAAAVVKRDMFVDDFYTSCYDDDEAITLRKDVTNVMAKGGFPMRKFSRRHERSWKQYSKKKGLSQTRT